MDNTMHSCSILTRVRGFGEIWCAYAQIWLKNWSLKQTNKPNYALNLSPHVIYISWKIKNSNLSCNKSWELWANLNAKHPHLRYNRCLMRVTRSLLLVWLTLPTDAVASPHASSSCTSVYTMSERMPNMPLHSKWRTIDHRVMANLRGCP